MFDFLQMLNKLNVGLVIIDTQQKIVLWNKKIEQISNIDAKQAVGCMLSELCPKFAEQKYQELIQSTMTSGNSCFCSGTLHSAFIYPKDTSNTSRISQNLCVNALAQNNSITHLLLEIDDITELENNQLKLMEEIEYLKKGYLKVKKSQKETRKLANYDILTGLYNRHAFSQKVNALIEGTENFRRKFALLFMDIDGFKLINDTHGHLLGDMLLQKVAGRLKKNSRSSDIICRLGGDEFIIVLTDINEKETISMVVEKIIDVIRKPFDIDNININITTSIGISVYPDDSDTLESLLKLADTAMYKAKQNGKNNFCFIS
jgi:diguanylate cyclase (GGDEF)-like protein/PAS domain S-box-containing protein